jgi:hypothetical protein
MLAWQQWLRKSQGLMRRRMPARSCTEAQACSCNHQHCPAMDGTPEAYLAQRQRYLLQPSHRVCMRRGSKVRAQQAHMLQSSKTIQCHGQSHNSPHSWQCCMVLMNKAPTSTSTTITLSAYRRHKCDETIPSPRWRVNDSQGWCSQL